MATRTRKRTRTKPVSEWPTYDLRFDPKELHGKLRIDKHALDDEVEQQPELLGEVSSAAALAKSQVDSIEEKIKEWESQLDAQFRADAEAAEEKITEGQVKAHIAGDQDRKAMVIQLLEAKHQQRQLDALSVAFKQRGYALRDVVDLYLSDYYSSRSATGMKADREEAEVNRIQGKLRDRKRTRVKRNRQRSSQS